MRKKVLVTGASIAGPTLAFWLNRAGFDVTVVERSSELRLGGQNIDIKDEAKTIAEKMGIKRAILDADTGEIGMQVVDSDNNVKASFPKGSSGGLTSEIEILRGDLVEILYNATKSDTRYLFDDSIDHVEQSEGEVHVTFASGKAETFALVIAADGFRSKERKWVVGSEPDTKFLHLYTAYLTIPKAATDTRWARWYNAPGGKVFLLRPDNKGTTRASFTFWSDAEEYKDYTPEQRKDVLKQKLANSGWEADRIAQEVDKNDDVYFDAVSQVKASRWSKERIALVGDAAYCPTPLTGMGTSLAIIGAYVLAGELSRHDDHQEAFAAYDKVMRPYVESIQKLPPGSPRLVYPQSKIGVAILNGIFGLFASKPVTKLMALLGGNGKKQTKSDFVLPKYAALEKETALAGQLTQR